MTKFLLIAAVTLMGIPAAGFMLFFIIQALTDGHIVGLIAGCGMISMLVGGLLLLYVDLTKKNE